MARKELPRSGDDALDYRAFMTGLLAGTIKATALADTTVPDGTRDVTIQVFVEDPKGDVVIDDGHGGKVTGRFEARVATVAVRRLTKLEYDDPGLQAQPAETRKG